MGRPPISTMGFGLRWVSSLIRVPKPPARITAFIRVRLLQHPITKRIRLRSDHNGNLRNNMQDKMRNVEESKHRIVSSNHGGQHTNNTLTREIDLVDHLRPQLQHSTPRRDRSLHCPKTMSNHNNSKISAESLNCIHNSHLGLAI